MKNYKLIENRPALTKEQITQGMDFTKVKNDARLAKTTLKLKFLKGFISVIAASAAVFIYKNYQSPVQEKKKSVIVEQTQVNVLTSKDQVVMDDTQAVVKKQPVIAKSKSITQPLSIIQIHPTDTNVVKAVKPFTPENEQLENPEQEDTKKINTFIEPFSKEQIKEIDKTFTRINEHLYASKFEVTNQLYRMFLNSLRKSGDTRILSIAQIDSLKWLDKYTYNAPYVDYYHTHSAYDNYPVVNISYEGAVYFCEWLTEQYNTSQKRKFKKVVFRLPSESEWIFAARAGNNSAVYPWEGDNLDINKKIAANFKRTNEDLMNTKSKYQGDITTAVDAYWKNGFGIYNMSGNVAEMISDKGISKGGSWKDDAEALKISSRNKYDGKPQPYIGFRYFVEVIEK